MSIQWKCLKTCDPKCVYLDPTTINEHPEGGKPLQRFTSSSCESNGRDTKCTTYTLSLTHLMEVRSSSNYDYLSIAWVAQVGRQLPLSGSVPAHIEEYLDDDEYDDNSVEERRLGWIGKLVDRCVQTFISLYVYRNKLKYTSDTHMYQYSSMFVWCHWAEALIVDPWPKKQKLS